MKMKPGTSRIVPLLAAGALLSSANAQTISFIESHCVGGRVLDGEINSGGDYAGYEVSVYNPNAFIKDFAGATVHNLTGTVVDYYLSSAAYVGGASNIGTINNLTGSNGPSFDLWTDSLDPNSDPAISAYSYNISGGNPNGTIDITGITEGSLYVLDGTWNQTINLDARLVDTDGILSDVVMTQFAQVYNGAQQSRYAFNVDFADAGDYETLVWGVSGAGYYFDGVILTTPVPEPSGLVLCGLGSVLLLLRRRG